MNSLLYQIFYAKIMQTIKVEIKGVILECVKGDITDQPDFEAVVNAANAQLIKGGGVAGAIHRAAGPQLEAFCRPLAPIKTAEAVVTPAFNLPNRYVIHCLGPVYGVDEPSGEILANCYCNILSLAEEKKIATIAFVAISTGIFGFPVEEAADVAFKTVLNMIPRLLYVKRIRFVLYDEESLDIHKKVLARLLGC